MSSRPPIALIGRNAIEPAPAAPASSASASSSSRALMRDGTGRPSRSRWVGAADDDTPAAPAAIASARSARISAISAAVASRVDASGPITQRRRFECPT